MQNKILDPIYVIFFFFFFYLMKKTYSIFPYSITDATQNLGPEIYIFL